MAHEGEAARIRASAAAIHQVMAPPPEVPVTPSRVASTSGLTASRSRPRMPFHVSTPAGVKPRLIQ